MHHLVPKEPDLIPYRSDCSIVYQWCNSKAVRMRLLMNLYLTSTCSLRFFLGRRERGREGGEDLKKLHKNCRSQHLVVTNMYCSNGIVVASTLEHNGGCAACILPFVTSVYNSFL